MYVLNTRYALRGPVSNRFSPNSNHTYVKVINRLHRISTRPSYLPCMHAFHDNACTHVNYPHGCLVSSQAFVALVGVSHPQVVRVPQGHVYDLCAPGAEPNVTHPCELGVDALDVEDGDITHQVSR